MYKWGQPRKGGEDLLEGGNMTRKGMEVQRGRISLTNVAKFDTSRTADNQ